MLFALLTAALSVGAASGPSELEAEKSFEDRLDPAALEVALERLQALAQKQPSDLRSRLLLARAEAFWAQLHPEATRSEVMRHLEVGVQAAEGALALTSPAFGQATRGGKSWGQSLALIEPAGAEALYWLATDEHRLAQLAGIASLLLAVEDLRKLFHRVAELAPSTYYGGAYRHLAELDLALPFGFSAGLAAAQEELKTALRYGPSFLATHLVWAERYAVKAQDYALFLEQLRLVRKAPLDQAPEVWPENELTRERAFKLAQSAPDLFTRAAMAKVGADAGF